MKNQIEPQQTEELQQEAPAERQDFEESDASARQVIFVGICVGIGALLVAIISALWASYLEHNRINSSPPPLPVITRGNPLPPQPRLQRDPHEDLKRVRAEEDAKLHSYRWIDPAKGRVAIPIERAMQILAQRGIPPQKGPPGLVLSQPQAGTRQTGFEGKVAPEPQ